MNVVGKDFEAPYSNFQVAGVAWLFVLGFHVCIHCKQPFVVKVSLALNDYL